MLRRYKNATLTGRVRTRQGWFGKQILQVEESIQEYVVRPIPPGLMDYESWRKGTAVGLPALRFRDATFDDVFALSPLQGTCSVCRSSRSGPAF